ncbi:MAG: hypothetical protein ABIG44_06235 [Planctomycetota bacterium]
MNKQCAGRWMGLGLLIITLTTWPAIAEEIVVQNDSIPDAGGEVVIVGNFIQGEMAGARLTSPCDGTLVAVQILWLEGTPGHGQSLEQAIRVYDGASFPVPGPQLEILEGPVMTPGYWNEFRYLDEAQTLPLEVSLSAGQNFVVALEFYNPTDVGNGGPSVVRDVDGCQNGRNVLYGDIGMGMQWYNFCPIILYGDIAIRAIIDCPGATGACCYSDGICADDIEEDDCIAEFGATWHEGLTCAEITCEPRGACCRMGGCLQLVAPADCAAIGGTYAGDGTDCNDDVCVEGACCIIETGECIENFGFECDAIGGVFQGPGTTCTPNPCPQPPGACCFNEFCLTDQTEADCVGSGGEWVGPWTDCGPPNPCIASTAVCCHGYVCYDVDPDDPQDPHNETQCLAAGGTYIADDTCATSPCDCGGTDYRGDSNCLADGPNSYDIDHFIEAVGTPAAWIVSHACNLFCANDINCDGEVNAYDIDWFINCVGTGACAPCP